MISNTEKHSKMLNNLSWERKKASKFRGGRQMAITINIYYSGTNGGAREFAKEMIASGIVEAIRAEKKGIVAMNTFFQWTMKKQFC